MAPHELKTATTGQAIKMHGMPMSWSEMWTQLRRLPRPHLSTSGTNQSVVVVPSRAEPSKAVQKGLALENSVTGSNHPKRAREKEAETYKTRLEVSAMTRSLSQIESKKLYFLALPNFEGEMAVGVGRVSKLIGETRGEVEWLLRRGWSDDDKSPGYEWAKSPMLDAYLVNGKVQRNEHPLEDFLPVQVELTEGSNHNDSKVLSHKSQRFCISAKCVVRLKEFCTLVRPELIKLTASKHARKA